MEIYEGRKLLKLPLFGRKERKWEEREEEIMKIFPRAPKNQFLRLEEKVRAGKMCKIILMKFLYNMPLLILPKLIK
jgi:hypothetical protein